MFKVSFITENITVEVAPGTTLLEAEIAAGLKPDAPCGGMGRCGKCTVDILGETGERITVLACSTPVERDVSVVTAGAETSHRILTEGIGRAEKIAPPVRSAEISVEKAKLSFPTSGWHRLSRAINEAFGVLPKPDPEMADGLSQKLETLEYRPEAVMYKNELLTLRSKGRLLTAAVDIGTTTVVLYLADGISGELLSTASMLNPQTEFGADVISRANYAMQNGAGRLAAAVRNAVNELMTRALEESGCSRDDIYSVVIVGNTCMHHLFLGIDPASLVLSPYVPSISDPLVLKAADYGISANKNAKIFLLPCIAGFVGADTSSVMLACEFDRRGELTLAIDIGTNGEMALGDRHRAVACSTAAGPAFEGAKIACGMRGAEGAVDHVKYKDGKIEYTVIGSGKPRGICGSGLLDLTAALLEAGILDETGRLLDEDEIDGGASELAGKIEVIDSQKAFIIADADESENGRSVYLSQKDIREVQLAKAAMAAGISLLLDHLGKKISDIKNVFIAGAFGNYMSPESACAIGLIPSELLKCITAVGNAAGQGALMCALDADCLERTVKIVEKTEFIELAANPDFQDCFVDELMFPEGE